LPAKLNQTSRQDDPMLTKTIMEAPMRRITVGWTLALAIAFAVPTLAKISAVEAKAAKSDDTAAADKSLSKEEQAKLKEHNKLRSEIMKVKYPAPKADVVSHIKGVKADDKKWFEETLADKTYNSADEVMTALGWETTAAAEKTTTTKTEKTTKTTTKAEKAPK
jgi:uncharacterized membrane protein YraQ (UPF0718 family)